MLAAAQYDGLLRECLDESVGVGVVGTLETEGVSQQLYRDSLPAVNAFHDSPKGTLAKCVWEDLELQGAGHVQVAVVGPYGREGRHDHG